MRCDRKESYCADCPIPELVRDLEPKRKTLDSMRYVARSTKGTPHGESQELLAKKLGLEFKTLKNYKKWRVCISE